MAIQLALVWLYDCQNYLTASENVANNLIAKGLENNILNDYRPE